MCALVCALYAGIVGDHCMFAFTASCRAIHMFVCACVCSYLETLQQIVAEKKKVASLLARCDAQAMELQSRLDEKEGRGKLCFEFSLISSLIKLCKYLSCSENILTDFLLFSAALD